MPEKMLLVGLGAIGTTFLWSLDRISKDNIVIKVKNDEQKEKILNDGIVLNLPKNGVIRLRNFSVIVDWQELGEIPQWIFVTLKIPDLLEETRNLEKFNKSDTRVVYFQNGFLEDYLPKNLITTSTYRVVCWWASKMLEFGSVECIRFTATHAGMYVQDAPEEDKQYLSSVLQSLPVPIRWFDDIRPVELNKLIFNAALNGLTYLTSLNLSEILRLEEGELAFSGIISEGIQLSRLLGYDLPKILRFHLKDFSLEATSHLISRIKRKMYLRNLRRVGKDLISSARMSYLRGRKSELYWLNGFIQRKCIDSHLDCPWNEAVMKYHEMIETGQLEPSPKMLELLYQDVMQK